MEKKLNELNIFALRDLARRTGVKSPTSKKKEELIKEIVDILSGKQMPAGKTKQGRPPKTFGYDFANVFDFQNSSQIMLGQPKEEYSSDKTSAVAGWLEVVNNNSAILWINQNFENENYFISSEILNGIQARSGDRAVVEICLEENQRLVKKLFSLNDCPITQLKSRINFAQIHHVSKVEKIKFKDDKFNDLNLNKAENIYCYGTNNKLNTERVVEMLNSCESENKIYVNISLTDKNKDLFNGLNNVETFVSNVTENLSVVRRLVALAIERAKRILEIGEDVVLVVDDMLSIVGIDNENLNLVKTFASIAKQASKGSITLIAVMPNENIIQIEKLADKRLKF